MDNAEAEATLIALAETQLAWLPHTDFREIREDLTPGEIAFAPTGFYTIVAKRWFTRSVYAAFCLALCREQDLPGAVARGWKPKYITDQATYCVNKAERRRYKDLVKAKIACLHHHATGKWE